jgi:hypothetical protein
MKQPIRYTDKPQIAATLTEFDINDYFELPHHVVLQSFSRSKVRIMFWAQAGALVVHALVPPSTGRLAPVM